ncbi:transcriptional repressor LexA [Streptomyces sp. XY413]|uniref:transcriptional repressor LexA n=1 Tax=Streptomyces sp. XY413 TaxID=1519479 RepID=UPI000AB5BEA1|nr:transcriptional repressor LexA [Streptomyces sp. XY413]
MAGTRSPFLGLLPLPERQAITRALRTETVGGLVLLGAAVLALIWANSPWSAAYASVRDFHFGIPALGLDLSVGHWTADGLLAVFFLVAGIELKRELAVGELRTPATAALPVIAALCGMAVPAALYLATTAAGGGSSAGWAVPMATDIAFALAVLAVLSTHLPAALRAFLLTLAVVDDLGAILIIAVFFTSDLNLWALAGAFAGLALFYLLQRLRVRGWWWYVPLGLAIWALMYNGGVHATVAGVAMGLILRTTRDKDEDMPGCGDSVSLVLALEGEAIDLPAAVTATSGLGRPRAGDEVLTTRQQAIVDCITNSLEQRGYPPSMREIGSAVGLTSTSSVAHQLRALEKKKALRRDPHTPRAYCLPGTRFEAVEQPAAQVPLVGRIAAGAPILAEEAVEDVLPLPRRLVGEGKLFALTVVGESMIEAAICPGDVVTVRRQDSAQNGDIVASLGEKCGATRSQRGRCSSAALRTRVVGATGVVLSLDRANH